MAYILFALNFGINWCILFVVMAFALQHLHATWTMAAVTTTAILIGIIIFFSTVGIKYLRYGIPQRPLNQREAAYLDPVIKEVFKKANINIPKIFMQDEQFPNAMVVGDAMILTTGLLRVANRNEVAAVIAHECGHIVNKDLTFASINYATAKMSDIAIIAGIGFITIISLNGRIPFIYLPYIMIAGALKLVRWILLGIVDFASKFYHRKCEYDADSFAASIGYRQATISYFSKLAELYPSVNKSSIFYTHPSLKKRIEAIERA
jgi:Zn-dependent protease with chaperone function